VNERELSIHKKNKFTSRTYENQVIIAAKYVGEKLQVQMNEGRSNMQHQVLPKAEVGVSQDFSKQFERTHRVPRDGE
jgi:hypothetical protein